MSAATPSKLLAESTATLLSPALSLSTTTIPSGACTIKLADGKIVDRSTQYDLTNRSDATTIKWSGRHLRHPNLWMEGVWRQVNATHAVYTETLHDDDKNKIVAQDVAECDKYVAPSAPVSRKRPAASVAPQPSTTNADGAVSFTLGEELHRREGRPAGLSGRTWSWTPARHGAGVTTLADKMVAEGHATEAARKSSAWRTACRARARDRDQLDRDRIAQGRNVRMSVTPTAPRCCLACRS